jgi:hypothetical protein
MSSLLERVAAWIPSDQGEKFLAVSSQQTDPDSAFVLVESKNAGSIVEDA